MTRTREHFRYELKDGRQVVYIGITNDPEAREQEHFDAGKRFSHLLVVGPAVTRDTAEGWDEDRLAAYRRSHGGRNPRYNKTETGGLL